MSHTPSQKPAHFKRTVTLLLMLVFGGFMISDMYLPALPHLISAFHTTSKHIQLTISVYFIGACASMLILGPISDRIGRRKVVLSGVTIMIIGTFFCWYTSSYHLFVLGRVLQGLGAGAGFAVMRTVMRDMVSGNDFAHIIAYISIIVGICPAIAPALGGMIVTHFHWRIIFLISLIYYLFLLVALIMMFPETLAKTTQIKNRGEHVIKHAWEALSHSEFLLYCITSAVIYAGMMAYVTASPMIIEVHLHFTPAQFGWITLGVVLSGQMSKIYNRLYVLKKGYQHMLYIGISLLILGSLTMLACALLHFMNIYAVVIPMVIYSNGLGIFFPNLSTASLSIFTTMIGMASAIYGTVQLGGGFLGSAIMAHLSEHSLMPLSSLLVIFIAIATACLFKAIQLQRKHQPVKQTSAS